LEKGHPAVHRRGVSTEAAIGPLLRGFEKRGFSIRGKEKSPSQEKKGEIEELSERRNSHGRETERQKIGWGRGVVVPITEGETWENLLHKG